MCDALLFDLEITRSKQRGWRIRYPPEKPLCLLTWPSVVDCQSRRSCPKGWGELGPLRVQLPVGITGDW